MKDHERDKNWERVLRTAIGFGKKHGRWPTRMMVDPGILSALEFRFGREDFRVFTDGIDVVPTAGVLRAEADDGDTYDYGESLATRMTYSVNDPRPTWLTLDLAAPTGADREAAEEAATTARIADLVRQWHAAIKEKDLDTLRRIWADDYKAVGPDGVVSARSDELEKVASPDLVFEELDVGEFELVLLGEAAVARSLTRAKGVGWGEAFESAYRNTTVAARRAGRWVVVATQSTQTTQPPPMTEVDRG